MPRPTDEMIARKPTCPRCGSLVVPTDNADSHNDYTWTCHNCDEDFFNIEVHYAK